MNNFLSWGSARKIPISMQIFLLSRSTPSFPHAHFNQLLGAQSRKVDSSSCDATQIPPPNSTIKNIFASIVVIIFCTFGKIPLSVGPRKPTVDGTEGGSRIQKPPPQVHPGKQPAIKSIANNFEEEDAEGRRLEGGRGREGSFFLSSSPPP